MKRSSWITLVIAGVAAAASIAWFWLNLPEWGYCIEEGPHQGCETGVFISNAIAGTVAVVVGLVLLVVGLLVARGRRGFVTVAIAAFGVLLLVGWVLQLASLEEVPMPI